MLRWAALVIHIIEGFDPELRMASFNTFLNILDKNSIGDFRKYQFDCVRIKFSDTWALFLNFTL